MRRTARTTRCDGPLTDPLSIETIEPTLRRPTASAITQNAGGSSEAMHFELLPPGPSRLTGNFVSILARW